MKFSIVIPVHNSEKYIDECIEKCFDQDYEDFEIILVINGSLDQSENICNSWKLKDDRIKVISLDTAGVSNARNVGLLAAKGDWIIFVDSDDYLLQRSSTKHLLSELRNTRLSLGKVQNIFFIVLLRLLRLGLYRSSFVIARCYAKNKKKG